MFWVCVQCMVNTPCPQQCRVHISKTRVELVSTLSTLGKRYGARAATLLLHYRYIIATLAHRKSPAEPRVGSFGRRPGADFRVRRDSRIARIARYKGHIVRVSLYRAIRGGKIIVRRDSRIARCARYKGHIVRATPSTEPTNAAKLRGSVLLAEKSAFQKMVFGDSGFLFCRTARYYWGFTQCELPGGNVLGLRTVHGQYPLHPTLRLRVRFRSREGKTQPCI